MPLHHPPTEAELTALAHRLAYSALAYRAARHLPAQQRLAGL